MNKLFGFRQSNLSIFTRLVLGNLALLVIATGVSVYAILQLDHMQKITNEITHVHNILIDLEMKMTGAFLSEVSYEKKFALLHNPVLYKGFLSSKSDFEKHLKTALAVTDSAKVKKGLSRLSELNNKYHALFRKEIASKRGIDQGSNKRHTMEKEKVINEVTLKLTELRTLSQLNIMNNIKKLDEAGTRARNVAMVITGIALLFGVALSFGITRSITFPLSRIDMKTQNIAKGIYEPDLDISSPPEIRALAATLNTTSIRLKEIDRMKSDFYSLMSHELRTPLTSIREGTNLLLEGLGGEITKKQQELLIIIAEESSRLLDLVSRLLELSKLEAGVLKLNPSKTELSPLIARSLREMTPLAAAKNIRIEVEIGEIPSVSIEAERILQVLRNLISNALKFTPPGGMIRVTVRRSDREVNVSIADTGPGIPEEEIGVIFEKFHQASSASSLRFQGTGLGLAIVRHIIEAHGGKVWVKSEVGQGSTFTFALPV